MLRDQLIAKNVGIQNDFQLRGEDASRLEGFSDAVFGFALTLVVVSLDVPKTFDQLITTMLGVPSFLVCFAILIQIWFWHYRFFRRYGLQDTTTIVINSVLLFVVIFYVYPLKYLFTLFVNSMLGIQGGTTIETAQLPILYAIYGAGYLLINVLFAALYYNAYRQRTGLALTAIEVFETRRDIIRRLLMGSLGLFSAMLALITHDPVWPGLSYMAIAPLSIYIGRSTRAGKRKLGQKPT